VSSPWPIERIWRANQPDAASTETMRLEGDGVRLEVRRIADEVTYRSLDAGTFAWRSALAGHQPLEEAVEAALAVDPDFDLTTALQTLFAEGLVVE
jgi:hypothetical protein